MNKEYLNMFLDKVNDSYVYNNLPVVTKNTAFFRNDFYCGFLLNECVGWSFYLWDLPDTDTAGVKFFAIPTNSIRGNMLPQFATLCMNAEHINECAHMIAFIIEHPEMAYARCINNDKYGFVYVNKIKAKIEYKKFLKSQCKNEMKEEDHLGCYVGRITPPRII